MKWIDTHAHYDMEVFKGDRNALIEQLVDAGVERIICPAVSFDSIQIMKNTLEQFSNVYFAFGQHPKYLLRREQRIIQLSKTPKYKDLLNYVRNAQTILYSIKDQIKEVSSQICLPRVCAIGEVGLDYSYNPDPDEKALQSAVFRSYVELALKQKLPIILHVRDAHEDALNILRSYNTRFTGVIHCFRGSKDLADLYYKELGFLIGIGTSIFKYSQLREAIRDIDLDSIVLETDSPYLSIEGITDERNTSFSLPFIAEAIGREKGISTERVAETVYNNTKELFRL